MRNLARFIIRFNFPIIFFVFEIIAVVLILSNNPIQRGYFSNRFDSISASVYNLNFKVAQYIHLLESNEELARENALLRSNTVADSIPAIQGNPQFDYVPGRVLNNSIHKVYNYLTLDVGANDGVGPDQGVMSPFGIVGVVKSVSPHYSRVISLLNRQLMVSVKLANSDYFGTMNWEGSDYMETLVSEIPSHADVEPGDTILTSGYSAVFPPDIPIAIVKSSEPVSGGNFLEIKVRLINDFKQLSVVYVVRNNDREEILMLEEEL
jgi:rod shape-determining protein MreC